LRKCIEVFFTQIININAVDLAGFDHLREKALAIEVEDTLSQVAHF
jgi:hypothetical protein